MLLVGGCVLFYKADGPALREEARMRIIEGVGRGLPRRAEGFIVRAALVSVVFFVRLEKVKYTRQTRTRDESCEITPAADLFSLSPPWRHRKTMKVRARQRLRLLDLLVLPHGGCGEVLTVVFVGQAMRQRSARSDLGCHVIRGQDRRREGDDGEWSNRNRTAAATANASERGPARLLRRSEGSVVINDANDVITGNMVPRTALAA